VSPRQARRIQEVLSQPPREWDSTSQLKAASAVVGKVSDRKVAFGFGDEDEEEGAAPAAPSDPLQEVEDELHQTLLDRVKKRIKRDLSQEDVEEALSPEDSTAAPNDTIIKEGGEAARQVRLAARRAQYSIASAALIRTASSDIDLLNRLVQLDRGFGLEVNPNLYRAGLRVGSTRNYASLDMFLATCRRVLGGSLDPKHARTLIRLGKSLSALENNPARSTQS
jgi:hypothetical protein